MLLEPAGGARGLGGAAAQQEKGPLSSSPPCSSDRWISRSARSRTSSGPSATSAVRLRMPSSRSVPGCSTSPSVHSSRVCPGSSSRVATGYSSRPNSADSPSGSPPSTGIRAQLPVAAADQRIDVSGADHLDDSGGQVGLGVQAGGEPVGVEFVEEDGGAGHHGGRVALGGVGAQHDPQLAHDGRRVRVVALDVPDDRADPAARQRDQVVPVAADVPAEGRRAVADRDVGAADAGDGAGQHGLLEALGEVLLPARRAWPA